MKFSQEQLDQLEQLFDRKFDEKLAVFRSEFKSELLIEVNELFDKKFKEQQSTFIVAVGEMIEEQILPQLHEAKETTDHHQRVLVATRKALATA